MLPRPRFRIPLWAAFAIVAVAYVGRSAIRGFDFTPDLPIDAIVGGLFLLVVGIVAWVRATMGDDADEPNDAPASRDDDSGHEKP